MFPYGPLLGWGWAEGAEFMTSRGFPEPSMSFALSNIVADFLEGLLNIVRKLPLFDLHPDLKLTTVLPADAYAHLAQEVPILDRNWDIIQAGYVIVNLLGIVVVTAMTIWNRVTVTVKANFGRLCLSKWESFDGCLPFFLSRDVMSVPRAL